MQDIIDAATSEFLAHREKLRESLSATITRAGETLVAEQQKIITAALDEMLAAFMKFRAECGETIAASERSAA